MNYLVYIEHAAENLQFWLWLRDYTRRFFLLPSSEQSLAPEWVGERDEAEPLAHHNIYPESRVLDPTTVTMFKGAFSVSEKSIPKDPFITLPRVAGPETSRRASIALSESGWSDDASTVHSSARSFQKRAADAFESADIKLQPCMPANASWNARRLKLTIHMCSHHPTISGRTFSHHCNLYHRWLPSTT